MKEDTYTTWAVERLLPEEDLSGKKQTLRQYTDRIDDTDQDLRKLINEVIADDQKGEIVESLEEATQKLKKHKRELLEDADQRIQQMVANLNEQVEDLKEQRMKITYEDPLSARGNAFANNFFFKFWK